MLMLNIANFLVVVKRAGAPAIHFQSLGSGACDPKTLNFDQTINDGACTNLPQGNYGGIATTGDEKCVFRFYSGANCTSKYVSWAVEQLQTTKCIPIANDESHFTLGPGAKSFCITCAQNFAVLGAAHTP
ncbi:hypothetical protein B0T24DRAFT_591476 [Lasiosphaeria ovina]|uniref:Secreted protein n=1 Tax=Lasiosphaeria ovina TaxID=92902 RepID=A0AAE0KFK0_9PEZI|nr:hypothetical protein B0T24DRAFT_591476 [Lasiosphaeria ovina]